MPRGRPRRQGVPREPNGRKSRQKLVQAETQREAREVAVTARIRVHGVPMADALDPKSGALIGRMCLVGDISEDQHEAALEWIKTRAAALIAWGAPNQPHEPREGGGIMDEKEHVRSCRRRIERYEDASAAVLDWPARYMSDPALRIDALDAFLLREEHIPRLVPHLKEALNALNAHWSLDARRKVA